MGHHLLTLFARRGGGSSLLAGLISYWKMEEASGTRVDSVTASGNTLTDNNTVTSNTGIIGAAAEFTLANNEYLSIAAALTVNGQSRSVALWAFPTDVAAQHPLASAGATFQSSSPLWLIVCKQSGTAGFAVFHGGTYRSLPGAATLANTWYHVVYTFNSANNNVGLYVNGVREVNLTQADTNTGANTFIGAGFNVAYGGRIDEVGLWNRALTQAEVTTLYNGGAGRTYPFLGT